MTSPITAAQRRAVLTSIVSATLEWYDFFAYGLASALVFSKVFFPGTSTVAGVLASFATFAIGFVVRPLGGIVFGHFGDRLGRRRMVILAVLLASAATALVGLIPSYGAIGPAAPVLLILLRIAQGFAIGGQFGGVLLLSAEHAPAGRRALFASSPQLAVPFGDLLANLVFLLMENTLSTHALHAWGWRAAFLLGGAIGLAALMLALRIEDTPDFEAARHSAPRRFPIADVLRRDWRQVIACAGANIAVNATFYILVVGMLDYGTRELDLAKSSMLTAILISVVVSIISIPAFGALADRAGRRRVVTAGGVALLVWAVPMILLVRTESLPLITLALSVAHLCVGAMMGTVGALFTDAFHTERRFSGVSLSYQIGAILGGGIAPFVMVLLLDRTGTDLSISGYVIVVTAITLASIPFIARNDVGARPDHTSARTGTKRLNA